MRMEFEMLHSLISERMTLGELEEARCRNDEACESPAETAFVPILLDACTRIVLEGHVWCVHVWQQRPMGGRRADWLLSIVPWSILLPLRNYKKVRVAIEVDGKAYHSDEDAFTRDRTKDRNAAGAGIVTLRYPAKEAFSGKARLKEDLLAVVEAAQRREGRHRIPAESRW